MEWSHIRYIPVEDDSGVLVGLLGHRALLRLVARGNPSAMIEVRDLMVSKPVTVHADMLTSDAVRLMREKKVSCLPVVDGDRLIGMITERDLIVVSARLLENFLEQDN